MAINAVFSSKDWGKTKGTAYSEGGLFPGGVVYVSYSEGPPITGIFLRNGKEEWNPPGVSSYIINHIIGPGGACVHHISLRKRRDGEVNVFEFILEIQAQGPKGLSSGSLRLEFINRYGQMEYIDIWSSMPRDHTLGIGLTDPAITQIRWYHVD